MSSIATTVEAGATFRSVLAEISLIQEYGVRRNEFVERREETSDWESFGRERSSYKESLRWRLREEGGNANVLIGRARALLSVIGKKLTLYRNLVLVVRIGHILDRCSVSLSSVIQV